MHTDLKVRTMIRDGRYWWLFSDGRAMPAISGGADGDGGGDGGGGDGAGSGDGSGDGDGKGGDNDADKGKGTGSDKDDGDTPDHKAEADKWKALARKHEAESKKNAKALEDARKASMSETEKAIADAKDEGRREATLSTGAKLVDAEIRAVAAGRMTDAQRTTLLEGLDRSLFLTDDGDVDTDKVARFVDGIAPKADADDKSKKKFPDMGQGRRQGGAGPSVSSGRELFAARRGKDN